MDIFLCNQWPVTNYTIEVKKNKASVTGSFQATILKLHLVTQERDRDWRTMEVPTHQIASGRILELYLLVINVNSMMQV